MIISSICVTLLGISLVLRYALDLITERLKTKTVEILLND
jgi:hypothetical protein